jgi:hypothetical protein
LCGNSIGIDIMAKEWNARESEGTFRGFNRKSGIH